MKSSVLNAKEKLSKSFRERRLTSKVADGRQNTTELVVDIAHYWGVFLKETCVAVFKYKAEALNYVEERSHLPLNVIEVERKS